MEQIARSENQGTFGKIGSYFRSFPELVKESAPYRKVALILNLCLPTFGPLLMGEVEFGILLPVLFYTLCFGLGYMSYATFSGILGINGFSYAVTAIILLVSIIAIWLVAFTKTSDDAESYFTDDHYEKSYIAKAIKKLALSIGGFFQNFSLQYSLGEVKEKTALGLSFFVMGVPLMMLKQWTKGIAFFLIQLLVTLFMIARGFSDISLFFQLGVTSGYRRPLVYGVIALVVLVLFLVFYVINLKATLKAAEESNRKRVPEGFSGQIRDLVDKRFYVTALMVPVAGALVFTVIPLVFMIVIAFTNYSSNPTAGYSSTINNGFLEWVGLDTFKRMFAETANLTDIVSVFAWTIIWALLATFTCYFGGLLLALLLNKKAIKGKVVFRSLFVISMAMPQFVSLLVMKTMFLQEGPINTLLKNWGWIEESIMFWDTEFIARMLIIFINMWVGIPYYMLLMSGLLINIPKDYYEAATIDGASRIQQFNHITFPNILFMTAPVLITSFVSNINNFNVIWFLTGGGPNNDATAGLAGKTDILITWLYKLTMNSSRPDYNFGAAIGIIMFIITATLSLIIFRRSKSYKNEETYQ